MSFLRYSCRSRRWRFLPIRFEVKLLHISCDDDVWLDFVDNVVLFRFFLEAFDLFVKLCWLIELLVENFLLLVSVLSFSVSSEAEAEDVR